MIHKGFVNTAIMALNDGIDAVTDYIKTNGLAIAGLLLVVWLFKTQYKQQASKSKGYVLSSSTGQQPAATPAAATSSATPSSREEEMRKVRLRQQEIANQRALVAEKLRKEKEAAEKARKNQVILQKHLDGGRRMDGVGEDGKKKDDGDDNKKGGYNPLQPWSAGSSGFRPSRRSTPRA